VAILKLGLPLALFVYLLWRVDRADYQAFLSQPKRWDLLALAQLIALAATVFSFVRWRLLVRAFDIPFSLTEAMRLGFLGYLLNFISFGSVGGDVFKAILVARGKPEKRPEAVASVLVDRAFGLLGLVVLAWCSLSFLGENLRPVLVGIRRGAGVVALVSILALLFAVYAGRWFEGLINWLEKLPLVGEALARMTRAVRLLRRSPATIPLLLGMAIGIHAMLTITVFLVSHGVYESAPTLNEHFMVIPPGMAAGTLPLAPGGIGVQEGAIAGMFQQLPNLPDSFEGIIVATVYRLITIAIAGIGAAYYFASHGREFRQAQVEAKLP
jgi:glycosyltransferase 2 family protein